MPAWAGALPAIAAAVSRASAQPMVYRIRVPRFLSVQDSTGADTASMVVTLSGDNAIARPGGATDYLWLMGLVALGYMWTHTGKSPRKGCRLLLATLRSMSRS